MVLPLFGVLVVYGLLALYDLIPLVKERQIKEAAVYSGLSFASLVFSIVLVLQVPIVSLSQLVERVVRMFFDI